MCVALDIGLLIIVKTRCPTKHLFKEPFYSVYVRLRWFHEIPIVKAIMQLVLVTPHTPHYLLAFWKRGRESFYKISVKSL